MRRYCTVKQLAEMLGVPVSQVYRKTREGELPHIRIGKYIRFDPDEVVCERHSEKGNFD